MLLQSLALVFGLRIGHEVLGREGFGFLAAVHVGDNRRDNPCAKIGARFIPGINPVEGYELCQLPASQARFEFFLRRPERDAEPEEEAARRPPAEFFSSSSTSASDMPLMRCATSNALSIAL